MQDNLIPMTIRLDSAVGDALARAARAKGQEMADYAAELVSLGVMSEVQKTAPEAADRLKAEIKIKEAAIGLARELGPIEPHPENSDVTLRVFRRIREDDDLGGTYVRAIGGRPAQERGNPTKARLNRAIGASIKAALGADSRMEGGKPAKVQVAGEYIFSYTPLILPRR